MADNKDMAGLPMNAEAAKVVEAAKASDNAAKTVAAPAPVKKDSENSVVASPVPASDVQSGGAQERVALAPGAEPGTSREVKTSDGESVKISTF